MEFTLKVLLEAKEYAEPCKLRKLQEFAELKELTDSEESYLLQGYYTGHAVGYCAAIEDLLKRFTEAS